MQELNKELQDAYLKVCLAVIDLEKKVKEIDNFGKKMKI